MNKAKLALYWRHGWHVLFAYMLFSAPLYLAASLAKQFLPDIGWLRWAAFGVLVVFVAPVLAWAAIQFLFPGIQLTPILNYVAVAVFPDEHSAHIAVSALEAGVRAVVEAGQSLGLPRLRKTERSHKIWCGLWRRQALSYSRYGGTRACKNRQSVETSS